MGKNDREAELWNDKENEIDVKRHNIENGISKNKM